MELPAELRQAVERLLDDVPLSVLRQASKTLSDRYRAEVRDGRLHMGDDIAAKAYLAARLPATYAAIRTSLEALTETQPDFAPRTMLDIGAGPGTVLWAASGLWATVETVTLLEASNAARKVGQILATNLSAPQIRWQAGDVTIDLADMPAADLVTMAYVMDEIAPASLPKLVDRLWQLTMDTLVIVEPGTPAGWQRILDARSQLLAGGASITAPCPHHAACPLVQPDWCHFSRRVARSRLHRLTKEADVPWEDEKFIYLAASRRQHATRSARVLAPPRAGSGKVALKLCCPDGSASERLVTKRGGEIFKAARRVNWGDTIEFESA